MTTHAKSTRHGGRGFTPQNELILNQPGVFMLLPISSIKIDTEYQRSLTGFRVDRIKENWSWVACGCLTIALRGEGSGEYFCIDGQHRLAAAERAGITELPCLVFETQSTNDEAQGFLDVNTGRKSMSVIDRYRAMLVIQDPCALIVQELLHQADRKPQNNADDGKSVKCLDYILNCVQSDEQTLRHIWPLIIDICDGKLLTKKILQGLFYIERFLSNTSLTERHWRRRLLQIGYDTLSKSIDETCQYEGKAGSAICAQGILRAVNRGLRNKLELNNKSLETEI